MNKHEQEVFKQDWDLLNDILKRNYYTFFKKGKKNIVLTFSNNNYNNNKFINNYTYNYNLVEIKKNLKLLLLEYKKHKFKNTIIIDDDFWIYEQVTFLEFIKIIENSKIQTTIIINTNLFNYTKQQFILLLKIFNNLKNVKIKINIITKGKIINNFSSEWYEGIRLLLKNNYINYIKSEICPEEIKQWPENYDWWISFLKEDINKLILFESETKNWTKEAINDFLIFEQHYLTLYYNQSKNFIDDHCFNKEKKHNLFSLLDLGIIDNSNCSGYCKLCNGLNINVETLEVILCKKIQYEELIIGKFLIQNDQIIGCSPNNIPISMISSHLKRNMTPHCETCKFIGFCKGFCHGEAYNQSLNLLIPIRQSCDLRKSKYIFLLLFLINKFGLDNLLILLKEKINNILYYNYLEMIILDIVESFKN